jgi:hypothetical protein
VELAKRLARIVIEIWFDAVTPENRSLLRVRASS